MRIITDTFSGYNNDGFYKPNGSPDYVDGIVGKALSLDGSHYVEVPYSNSLYPRSNLPLTVEAWIKPAGYPPSFSVIMSKESCFILRYRSLGAIDFYISSDVYGYGTGSFPTTLEPGKWHHVAATFIPGSINKIMVYINGVLRFYDEGFSFGTFLTFPYKPLLIGACTTCGYENFNGLIDGVRVYYEGVP